MPLLAQSGIDLGSEGLKLTVITRYHGYRAGPCCWQATDYADLPDNPSWWLVDQNEMMSIEGSGLMLKEASASLDAYLDITLMSISPIGENS